jgi:hypothetical protein
MVAESWQPHVLAVNAGWSGGDGVDTVAVGSTDGDVVVVRIANWGPPLEVSLDIQGWENAAGGSVRVVALRGTSGESDEENTPSEPHRVATHSSDTVSYTPGMVIELDHLSFTVITAERGFREGPL